MQETAQGRFDAATYEASKRHLESLSKSQTAGLDALIASRKTIADIRGREAQEREKDTAGLDALIDSLSMGLPSKNEFPTKINTSATAGIDSGIVNTPTPAVIDEKTSPSKISAGLQAYRDLIRDSGLFGGNGKGQDRSTVASSPSNGAGTENGAGAEKGSLPRQPLRSNPQSSPQQTVTPERTAVINQVATVGNSLPTTTEGQIQNIREKFGKMSIMVNGEPSKINLSEFSFEKQPNGNFQIIHPGLSKISNTPIIVDAKGNFQTQSVEINFLGNMVGIASGTYSLSQSSDRLYIAKK